MKTKQNCLVFGQLGLKSQSEGVRFWSKNLKSQTVKQQTCQNLYHQKFGFRTFGFRHSTVHTNIFGVLYTILKVYEFDARNKTHHFLFFQKTYLKAAANSYIKYGDMPYFVGAEDILMKQKHRLVWDRRNGKLPSELGLDL